MKKKRVQIYKTVTVYNARLLKGSPNTVYIGITRNLDEVIVCLENGSIYITVNGIRVIKRYVHSNKIWNICDQKTLSTFAKWHGINLIFKEVEMKTYGGENWVELKEVKHY